MINYYSTKYFLPVQPEVIYEGIIQQKGYKAGCIYRGKSLQGHI